MMVGLPPGNDFNSATLAASSSVGSVKSRMTAVADVSTNARRESAWIRYRPQRDSRSHGSCLDARLRHQIGGEQHDVHGAAQIAPLPR